MDIKTWESVNKKINKLNEKFKGASLVVFGVVGKQVMVAGSEEIKGAFAEKPEVQHLYKAAVLGQTFATPSQPAEAADAESLEDILTTHVYDMNVDIMRTCIATAAGPEQTRSNKSQRRGWYKPENCPAWWRRTDIPFHSVNKPGTDGKKLSTIRLMELVESLQGEMGISPRPPSCRNKSSYNSMFAGEPSQTREDPPLLSTTVTELDDHCSSPQQEANISLSERKNLIQSLAACDTMNQTEIALKVMKNVKNWDVLWGLSDCILACFRKAIPTCLSAIWKAPKLTDADKRYDEFNFIPLTIGERLVLQATPDGNCIFNAVSIALSGDEKLAMMLRLLSVAAMADHLVELSKYLHEEYKHLASIWCESSTQATPDAIEKFLRDQLLNILKNPYTDGSILHLLLLCHLLSRPIQQHCVSTEHGEHRQLLHPPITSIQHPSAMHLVWVPTKPSNRYATISHVVPAVCKPGVYNTDPDECAFAGLGNCALTYGFNCQAKKPHWVCCSICDQWVHTICLDIPHDIYKNGKQFACGCDSLNSDGSCRIKTMDYYHQLSLDSLPDAIDLKEIAENLPNSLRKAVFFKTGNSRLKYDLRRRLGPFNDEFIHDINVSLSKMVSRDEIRLVPDMYMPEVLLRIIMQQEEVTRLIAEKILMEIH